MILDFLYVVYGVVTAARTVAWTEPHQAWRLRKFGASTIARGHASAGCPISVVASYLRVH
jgi:hypothetical protein